MFFIFALSIAHLACGDEHLMPLPFLWSSMGPKAHIGQPYAGRGTAQTPGKIILSVIDGKQICNVLQVINEELYTISSFYLFHNSLHFFDAFAPSLACMLRMYQSIIGALLARTHDENFEVPCGPLIWNQLNLYLALERRKQSELQR